MNSIGGTELSSNVENYSKAIVIIKNGVPEETIYLLLNKEEDILYYLGTPFYLGKAGENPADYLGEYVKYDSDGDSSVEDETILWRVLRSDGNKVELITADALGKVDFTPTDFNDARNKYNSAIATIVEECVRQTGISSVRSVGGPAIDTITETVVFQELETFDPNPETDFSEFEGMNGFKVEDNNYETDLQQMKKAGDSKADNSKEYWFASRKVGGDTYGAGVSVRCSYNEGKTHSFEKLCEVHISATPYWYSHEAYSYAVRPVLTLEAGVLEGKTGAGTKEQPIEIYQKNRI